MEIVFHRTAGVELIVPPAVDLFSLAPVVPLEKLQSFWNRHLSFPFELEDSAPEFLLLPPTGKQRLCQLLGRLLWGLSISGRSLKEAGYAE